MIGNGFIVQFNCNLDRWPGDPKKNRSFIEYEQPVYKVGVTLAEAFFRHWSKKQIRKSSVLLFNVTAALTLYLVTRERKVVINCLWPIGISGFRMLGISVLKVLIGKGFAVQFHLCFDVWASERKKGSSIGHSKLGLKFGELWLKCSPYFDQKQSVYWRTDRPIDWPTCAKPYSAESYYYKHNGDINVTS